MCNCRGPLKSSLDEPPQLITLSSCLAYICFYPLTMRILIDLFISLLNRAGQ